MVDSVKKAPTLTSDLRTRGSFLCLSQWALERKLAGQTGIFWMLQLLPICSIC